MNHPVHSPLTFAEAFDLPVVVDLRTAARAFGICTSTAYQLARTGTFPCPVLRIRGRYRISTAELMRVLGIEELPVYALNNDTGLDLQPTSLAP